LTAFQTIGAAFFVVQLYKGTKMRKRMFRDTKTPFRIQYELGSQGKLYNMTYKLSTKG